MWKGYSIMKKRKQKQKQIVHLPLFLHNQPCGVVTGYACNMKGSANAISSYTRLVNCGNCRKTKIYQFLKHNSKKIKSTEKKNHIITFNSSKKKRFLKRILKKYKNKGHHRT